MSEFYDLYLQYLGRELSTLNFSLKTAFLDCFWYSLLAQIFCGIFREIWVNLSTYQFLKIKIVITPYIAIVRLEEVEPRIKVLFSSELSVLYSSSSLVEKVEQFLKLRRIWSQGFIINFNKIRKIRV